MHVKGLLSLGIKPGTSVMLGNGQKLLLLQQVLSIFVATDKAVVCKQSSHVFLYNSLKFGGFGVIADLQSLV